MIHNYTHCQKRENRMTGNLAFVMCMAIVVFLMPEIAQACDATGLFTLGGGVKRCDSTQTGVFATVLCLFENTLESLLANMYCAFQTQMQGPLAAAFGTFIALFGISVLSGYIRMSFKEAAKVVLKLGLVMVFAINSDYSIQIVGKFFMGLLQSGTQFILNPLGGSSSLTQPDALITGFFNFTTNPNVTDLPATNTCSGASCVNEEVLRIITNCATSLFVLGLALVVLVYSHLNS